MSAILFSILTRRKISKEIIQNIKTCMSKLVKENVYPKQFFHGEIISFRNELTLNCNLSEEEKQSDFLLKVMFIMD